MILSTLAALLLGLQEPPKTKRPWHDVELSIGGFITELSAQVEVQSASGLGTTVDLENALGLEESLQLLRIWGTVAVGERHRLSLDYVDLTRSATKQIASDIEVGDQILTSGTVVDSTLELQLFNLNYAYSILYDDRMDIALTVGIHALRTRIELEGRNAGGETESFTLPIPLPGIRTNFALTPSLFLRQNLEVLYLRYANFQGLMLDLTISLEYQAFEHVGFGIGYNTMQIKMKMEEESMPAVDFDGRFEFEFAGLLLYTTFSF